MTRRPLTEQELNRHLPDFYPRIYRMVRTMVYGTGLDAEDITQDSFLKVYNKRHLYNGSSSLYTWVYQIARNTVLDALRRQKIKQKIFWWSSDEYDVQEQISAEEGNQTIERNELHRMVHEALGRLTESDRLILTMRDLEGLAYEEIATVEQVAIGTVKSRIFNARQRLKTVLEKMGVQEQVQSAAPLPTREPGGEGETSSTHEPDRIGAMHAKHQKRTT